MTNKEKEGEWISAFLCVAHYINPTGKYWEMKLNFKTKATMVTLSYDLKYLPQALNTLEIQKLDQVNKNAVPAFIKKVGLTYVDFTGFMSEKSFMDMVNEYKESQQEHQCYSYLEKRTKLFGKGSDAKPIDIYICNDCGKWWQWIPVVNTNDKFWQLVELKRVEDKDD